MVSAATPSQAPPIELDRRNDRPPEQRTAVEQLVRDVGDGIALRWLQTAEFDINEMAAGSAIDALVNTLLCAMKGFPLPSFDGDTWTADAPRLITELRRGILTLGRARGLPAHELLDLLGTLEAVLAQAEDDVATRFVQHLVGPSALELLVEIAHDVRSPLGSILFLVERMRRGGTGPVSPMQERHLGLVYSAAFGLSALASDMMELAHGGARLIGPAPVAFSMSDLLHAVRDVVQPIAEEKGLGLRFSAPREDVRIGHPAALTRVLVNLVTNALKFTNNGSVTVTAVDEVDGSVHFCVDDTGRGMPPAVMARITDVFARSSGSRTHSFSSAGLGIAICRKLLYAMGGSLAFSPVQPVGTRAEFTLVLPARDR